MNLEAFRTRLRDHLRQAGFQQQELADKLGLSNGMLSRKLNNTDGKILTAPEAKNIIKTLAEWQALARRSEAVELLELVNLTVNSFAPDEWEAEPLKSLENDHQPASKSSEKPKHNLPVQLTSLIGRERENEQACQLLKNPEVHLVTLSGPGGIGKTRLAIQIAGQLLNSFADGVYFISLDNLNDPQMIPFAIAQALGIKETGREPLPETLRNHLQTCQMLLVLDNFEQIVRGAPLIKDLLTASPQLKMLVTSRELLHLYGEHEFAVPPLSLPDAQKLPSLTALGQIPAIRLFIERARTIKHEFMLTTENSGAVAEICARLEGLPLAIELAAARTRLFTPQKILERLVNCLKELSSGAPDLPARQQSLRAAIEWSYNLLPEDEQTLFRRVAVFAGGCAIEAVEKICNPDGKLRLDAADGLLSLLDKSLLRKQEALNGEPVFFMLDMIREYALEKLSENGESNLIRQQHAQAYLQFAEKGMAKLEAGEDLLFWLNHLEAEHANLRAALSYALTGLQNETDQAGDSQLALQLGRALAPFWVKRSHFSEGRNWLETILSKCPVQPENVLIRTEVLIGAGMLAQSQGDLRRARTLYDEALVTWRELGDKRRMQRVLNNLSVIEMQEGRYEQAKTLLEESLQLARELGDKSRESANLINLGNMAFFQSRLDEAKVLYEQALDLLKSIDGDKTWQAQILNNLGEIELRQLNFERAKELLETRLTIGREQGDRSGIASALHNLGQLACLEGRWEEGEALYEEGFGIAQAIGHKPTLSALTEKKGLLAYRKGYYSEAEKWYKQSLPLLIELMQKIGLAHVYAGIGATYLSLKQLPRAARFLGASAQLQTELGLELGTTYRPIYQAAVEQCRDTLGAQFENFWQVGQQQATEQHYDAIA